MYHQRSLCLRRPYADAPRPRSVPTIALTLVLTAVLFAVTRVRASSPGANGSSARGAAQRPGDWNADGALTPTDFSGFPGCVTGPLVAPVGGCSIYDVHADDRIDLRDYRALQVALTGVAIPGDWNADGAVDLDDYAAADGCLGGPGLVVTTACGVFDFDADNDVDLADLAALQNPIAGCGLDPEDVEPVDWFDTAANNSMQPDDALFSNRCVNGEPVFGTTATATNIHAHFVGAGSDTWSGYVYTGRMMLTDPNGGIGVTFLSDYPNTDCYYRLRRLGVAPSFHIAAHPENVITVAGDTDTGVIPELDVWYHFLIEVKDAVDRTFIRAKVWRAGESTPSAWQVACFDDSANRLTAGTIGVWSLGAGGKYWKNLWASVISCADDVDSDGVADCNDACPTDPAKTDPGACGCFFPDIDSDLDGVPDCIDQCPNAPDVDTDSDGVADCIDACPTDPAKTAPLACGCGVPETDSDGDGTPNCNEPPTLCVMSDELNFGSILAQQGLEVWSCGAGALDYTFETSAPWISFSPPSGNSAGAHDLITALVDRSSLPPGRTTTTITLAAPSAGIAIPLAVTIDKDVLTPMARWNVVPRQRIGPGQTLTCGVVAFSKAGIDRVRFAISGQGYSGPATIDETQMRLNPRTNVWEYWTPIRADDFATDGMVTITATAIGLDGGVRDANTTPGRGLEPLVLWVNPNSTLPANTAWVNVGGNDATGAVNNPAQPFARISSAMQALAAFQGGAADGAFVLLRPGNHEADGGGVFNGETAVTLDEWITLTHDPAAGGTTANTVIDRRGTGDLTSMWLNLDGLTLVTPEIINGGGASDLDRDRRSVWLKDCVILGSAATFPFPVGSGWRGPHYYTECIIDGQRRAVGNGQNHKLMRNLTITNTREDIFQAVPFGVNIFVDNVDPGPGANPEHADVIQSPGAVSGSAVGMHNWIFYNVVATDLHYQALFSRIGAPALDNAFVNCLFEMRSPVRVGGVGTGLNGMYDHLLFWHCSFIGTGTFHQALLGRQESETLPTNQWLMANFSVRACLFERYSSGVGSAWFDNADVEFLDNHYITPNGIAGVFSPDSGVGTITTGDPQIVTDTASPDFGKPASAASPLVGRITPKLVPADARGVQHDASATVGALRD